MFTKQDTADAEFSVIKTAIARYLARSNSAAPDYIEVKDSSSVVQFLTKHLSKPSTRSEIQARIFTDIKPAVFLKRKEDALDKVKTLAGISTRYQYICEVCIYCDKFDKRSVYLSWMELWCGEGIPAFVQPVST